MKAQVDFGPRVPNTKAHVDCGNYLADKLTEFGAKVTNQYVDLPAYTGTLLKARNIIGSYKPDTKKRIVLFRIGTAVRGQTLTRTLKSITHPF